ncbi:MAG: hypothetical protein A3F83_06245 [Candidatus Glassbacteria bacterium RIFCSPLOWO2_12_FULL_58_11]|uniref:Flagellar biosynthesis protein FlgH n=2 Tax=Candidatus Glassiibacteriota TaxID=1817805 RepID=A0A1F5Z2U0_9BACT|nr:MAG: hypothetical protein A2Z86_05155 [Candidatus Glassbacteria bacterium GWA2_58_10]OGG06634.1 MAG: hypothetical protein A3F83_06245 [Candidatus Glassbacteria bacterium RIFCSPLOWO2_12_FULL_58_11]
MFDVAVTACLALAWAVSLQAQMEFRGNVASLFTDERLFKVGDVLTVDINERVQGQNRAQFRSQRGTSVEATFGAGPGKVFGLLNPFTGDASSTNNFNSRLQNDKLSSFITNISVRVVRSDELGNLYLEGSKVIDLPDEKQLVVLTGIARSRDVSAQNTISSTQLADLHITMNAKGEGEEARRPSLFNRLFNWFF